MKNNRASLSRMLMCASVVILAACAAAAWHPAHAADTVTVSQSAAQPELNAMHVQPGMTVMFKGDIAKNGTNTHPAIVTRSFNDRDIVAGDTRMTGMVNLSVVPDTGHHVEPRTSVTLYATEADGDRATAASDRVINGEPFKAKPMFAYFVPDMTATPKRPNADSTAGLAEVAHADQLSGVGRMQAGFPATV